MPTDSVSRAVLVTGCSSASGPMPRPSTSPAGGWDGVRLRAPPDSIADLEPAGCKLLALDVDDEDSMVAAVRG